MWNPFRTPAPPPEPQPVNFDVDVPAGSFEFRASGEWDLDVQRGGNIKLHWCDQREFVDLVATKAGGYPEVEARLTVAEAVSLARALIEGAKRAEKR